MARDMSLSHSKVIKEGHRFSVIIPRRFSGPLDYVSSLSIPAGTLVKVPLGRKEIVGCVWDDQTHVLPAGLRYSRPSKVVPLEKLRSIHALVENIPPLPKDLRQFIEWVAAYGLNPLGMVLAITLRVPSSGGVKPVIGWVKDAHCDLEKIRITDARRAVLRCVSENHPVIASELASKSGVTPSVIRGLAQLGVLREAFIETEEYSCVPQPDYAPPILSDEQNEAAEELILSVKKQNFDVTLLEGVTGSGKTEVYFEAVATCLKQGKQVLVLLPEIVLTTQWKERFKKRFGTFPAIWHSELGNKRRRDTWCAVASGEARVVVGARSALFLPFHSLGLIVVDEEHETTYKQEEGVLYHGRDMAIVRARMVHAAVILVSATPSMETLVNVEHGRYHHVLLEARHGGATLPEISLIDMRKTGPERGYFLSPVLCEGIEEAIQAGEQSMLFLNRRGYAPLTLCRACGHRIQCPHCSSWLVEHRYRRILACHHCEYTRPMVSSCPECQADDSLVPVGPGVERILEEVQERFPDARLLSMASDTLTSQAAMAEAVRKISKGDVDIIVGTQVLAKGWHFPDVTLVGVVDADLGLGGGDLRAAERTMQLLYQVSGRAGRGKKAGRVMLQSYVGEHPVMQALLENDFISFMEKEAAQRKPSFWPPYGRLAAVIISALKEKEAENIARLLAMRAPQREGVRILGPAPAPLALLRGRYRFRLLLRTRRGIAVQPLLRAWLEGIKLGNGARIDVDVDPISFM